MYLKRVSIIIFLAFLQFPWWLFQAKIILYQYTKFTFFYYSKETELIRFQNAVKNCLLDKSTLNLMCISKYYLRYTSLFLLKNRKFIFSTYFTHFIKFSATTYILAVTKLVFDLVVNRNWKLLKICAVVPMSLQLFSSD